MSVIPRRGLALSGTVVLLIVGCGGGPPPELNCGGCDCVDTIEGHVYELKFPPPPDPTVCIMDGMSRSFTNAGLCESANVVSDVDMFWSHTCVFPFP